MCGIFGVLWHNTEDIPDAARLKLTAKLLHHRGPDDFGVYSEPGMGLVHTRLALLDLNPRSNQPFWDRTGRYALVYNGEIYNFAELRAELEQQGIQFRTTSDTEVLLEALLKWGADAALPRFEGMFAFGLYDKVEKSFLLARDRFGIKPLFVCDTGRAFLFASEIAALRPWLDFQPDSISISGYLYGFSGPTRGFTFFEDVKFLDTGGIVKITKNAPAAYRRFFQLSDFVDQEETERLHRAKPGELVDMVDEILNDSVRSQLIADAPVGALCSGGIDSSLIMAMAARHHNNLAIFHANVVGPISEFEAASRLAKHLKLDLKAIEVRDQDFIDEIPNVTQHYGHPFYPSPHSVPYLMVSKLVRRHNVKAVISGEASDEYFLGYSYLSPNVRNWLRIKSLLKGMKQLLRPAGGSSRWKYEGPGYVGGGWIDTDHALVHALHNRFEVAEEGLDARTALAAQGRTVHKGVLPSIDLLNYNMRALLHRNDTMGMSASIEARFPLLDSRLARVALNMPYRGKIRFSLFAQDPKHRFFCDKWVIRKVADRYMPRDLSRREKKSFPVNAYAPERLRIAPAFFRNSFVQNLFRLPASSASRLIENSGHDLRWKLLLLEVWSQVCLHEAPKDQITARLREHVTVTNAASHAVL
jgi:asparagine synthase (glutamine-hydrolysing)